MKIILNEASSNVTLEQAAKALGHPDVVVGGKEIVTITLPTKLIVNLENSYEGGSHWVGVYSDRRAVYYFDSYGAPPLQNVVDIATKTNRDIYYNDRVVQSSKSQPCGWFALAFLITLDNTVESERREVAKAFALQFNTGSNQQRAGNLATLKSVLTSFVE
jgi:hypothetical protein